MPMLPRPALLLDRDGVINVDRGFVSRREDFDWMPGIFDVARTAIRLGMPLVVVTNQTGIGLGKYTEDDFHSVTAFMRERFEREGAALTAVYHCPFHPEAIEARYRAADHPWRKPRPGMLLAARDDLAIDLEASIMLGDRAVDMLAGHAAGLSALGLIGNADISFDGGPKFKRFSDLAGVPSWLEELLSM